MQLPEWTKPALWSALCGGAVGMLILSYGFGYMSPKAAERIADAKTEKAVIAVMAPVCAEKFALLPDVSTRLSTLSQVESSWQMRDIFPEKLVTLPGKSYADSDLIAECAKLVRAQHKSAKLQ